MARYSEAEWKPLPETKTQTRIAPRAIGLHTAVSNADSLWDYFNHGSEDDVETECHFYVPEDTKIEQYIDTNVMAHCQVDGNPFVISYETWDGVGDVWEAPNWKDIPALNDHQVDKITDSWAWASTVHNIPLRPMRFWNDRGIGYHRQFIGRPGWTRGYRDCPGDRKIKQIPMLINLAKEKANTMAITSEDVQKIRKIFQEELARHYTHEGPPETTVSARHGGRYSLLGWREASISNKKLDLILQALSDMADGSNAQEIAQMITDQINQINAEGIVDELAERLDPENVDEAP